MTFVLHIYICNYYSQSEMEIYMSENDFRKQLLIFALSQKAKQAGIQFTRQDCELIYKQIVPGGNPPEG